jgi:hypothetical protein
MVNAAWTNVFMILKALPSLLAGLFLLVIPGKYKSGVISYIAFLPTIIPLISSF